jgi:GNAT superfamily N-acetyltransferase
MPVAEKTRIQTKFAREPFASFFEEAKPLLVQHFEEISAFQDIPLDPNIERYLEMDGEGLLRIYTARQDGLLIGYAVFCMAYNLHYRSSLQAHQDVLFVHPSFRNFRNAYRLIKHTEIALREEGVQIVTHHSKLAHPALHAILHLMGYVDLDITQGKRLDL